MPDFGGTITPDAPPTFLCERLLNTLTGKLSGNKVVDEKLAKAAPRGGRPWLVGG